MNQLRNTNAMAALAVAFFFACSAGFALAEEQKFIELPSSYKDDIYHCIDPTNIENLMPCDQTTFRWKLDALKPSVRPDESNLCAEIVDVLVRVKESEPLLNPGNQQAQIVEDVQLWESILESSVVDKHEPCILWAMAFGRLAPHASSMGFDDHWQHLNPVNINDNSDPLGSHLEIAFDPFVIGLAWKQDLKQPLSLDRTELHDLTGRHILDALRAELGAENIVHLDLTVTAGLPDYQAKILPLTLSGKVVFNEHGQSLGPSSLQHVILMSAFLFDDARDLYRFRLNIAKDPMLKEVRVVVAGREAVTEYSLRPTLDEAPPRGDGDPKLTDKNNLTEEDETFISMLVAILSAVGAAILAVVCFTYFLIFRPKTSGYAAKTLEENSYVNSPSRSGHSDSSYRRTRMPNNESDTNDLRYKTTEGYHDGVPAVQTAPTETIEEDDEYDIEYVAGSQIDDGVSDYDMDTLPPPSSLPEDSDDDQSHAMSVMEGGFDDEIVPHEEVAKNQSDDSDLSEANTSLYSYIPDDTSLSMSLQKETALEKVQKKGLLWSVMKQDPIDTDDSEKISTNYIDGSDISTEQNYEEKKARTSMLGPSNSDNDSQSQNSNNLLYTTDDDTAITPLSSLSGQRLAEISLTNEKDDGEEDTQPQVQEQTEESKPIEEPSTVDQEIGDKKKKFEDLWKDENEMDEVASVLNYLDSAQSARRATETDSLPTSSIKIIDVATPVQTPERPTREDIGKSLVDMVPKVTDAGENEINLPLPVSLQDGSSSCSSGISGLGVQKGLVGASARLNKSNKWVHSSASVASSGSSVCSTDSAKFRSLLGQSDTNDAAVVFGKQVQQPTNEENSFGSSSTPDGDISMSSCTSGKLKSLLTRNDSVDSNSDDDKSEDFLFNNAKEVPDTRSRLQEEKKGVDDEDDDNHTNNYLPTSITPRGQPNSPSAFDTPDDATAFSALSDAPSVDESIATGMGWF